MSLFIKYGIHIISGNRITSEKFFSHFFVSISKLLGINNRVVENYREFSKIEEKIEYVNVSKILEFEKNKSIQKLKNTIGSL